MSEETTYDYIVVGSGSAGATMAARLSEDGRFTVLCMEAGVQTERYIWSRPPAGTAMMLVNPAVNWCLESKPSEHLAGRTLPVPRGKLLGGTSAINGLIHNRGQRRDYDDWAALGCTGWSYDDVLPYFKKLESTTIGSDHYRGRTGPMKVRFADKTSPFFDLFIQSAKSVGYPENRDYAGPAQYGVTMAQMNIVRGLRLSTATQYLAPARKRRNLTILTNAEAASLIIERSRCVGVRLRHDGVMREARARREVVVSAGTVGSPKLLELSGIGGAGHLRKLGIPVVKDLPGVGENLRDHYGPYLKWRFRDTGISLAARGSGWRLAVEMIRYALFRTGFISQGIATMRVFARSHEQEQDADIALLVNPYLVEIRNAKRRMSPVEGFFAAAQVQRPESAGSIHIESADPFAPPAIRYCFLATEKDRTTAIAAVRRAREIAQARPLADAIAQEIEPGPEVQSDEEILNYIRTMGATTYHMAGTCKMGNDAMAVVDERLRVHGVEGLRVADASIMPTIVSGNTSIPCIMIAEKCADMVLADAGGR